METFKDRSRCPGPPLGGEWAAWQAGPDGGRSLIFEVVRFGTVTWKPIEKPWLDFVAATPGLGMRVLHRYQTALQIAGAIAPLLDRFQKESGRLKINQRSVWDFDVVANDGRAVTLQTDNILVTFSYDNPVVTLQANARPSITLPEVRPYTTLLVNAKRDFEELVRSTASTGPDVQTNRLGVFAQMTLSLETAPPGLAALIRRIHAAAGGDVERLSFELLRFVAKDKGSVDKCHYNLAAKDGGPFVLMIDYQRYFDPLLTTGQALDVLEPFLDSALGHFAFVGDEGIPSADVRLPPTTR